MSDIALESTNTIQEAENTRLIVLISCVATIGGFLLVLLK